MHLKTRFIIFVGAIVVLSYGFTFYRTSSFQQKLVFEQAVNQARMLHRQIRLTRQWVADHNGLFLLKRDGVEANPFLSDGEIRVSSGHWLVKRNPAMVTRELSLYAAEEGFCQYGVISLHPINPANAPDEFERKGLERFRKGVSEAIEVETRQDGKFLRYLAPLYVESGCIKCHGKQGYEVGDIRGGLSVTVPMDWAYQAIARNNQMLLIIGVVTICLVSLVIFVLFDTLVARRLARLVTAMDGLSGETNCEAYGRLPAGNDEVGRLSLSFMDLCQRLTVSRQELARTQEQVIYNEKQAALGRLVAGLGHEINNPLAGMLNCVKIMEKTADDPQAQQRYLGLLVKGLDRVKHIVRQLLNFGRQESLHPQMVKVDDLIRECCELLSYSLNNIALQLDLEVRRFFPVDKEALKQVVMNVGMNAIQAMSDGGTLTVRSRKENGTVILEFEDTGTGISRENLSKIFEPFFTTKDVGEGTGLGLSVTYTLIQRMGGRIWVKSEEGQGSCFYVELPAASEIENKDEV